MPLPLPGPEAAEPQACAPQPPDARLPLPGPEAAAPQACAPQPQEARQQAQRRRLRRKTAADAWLPQEGPPTIHHVWLGKQLPALALEALRSFAPSRQVLWVLGPAGVPRTSAAMAWIWLGDAAVTECGGFPKVLGLTVKTVPDTLMPLSRLVWLLEQDVPVQFIKDELSLRIILRFGGVFTDLDVLSTGRELVPQKSASGYLFAQEPIARRPGRPARKPGGLSLATFGAPPRAEVLQDALAAIASNLTKVGRAGGHADTWLGNQRAFTQVILERSELRDAIAEPLLHLPFPLWLRSFPPPAREPGDNEVPTLAAVEGASFVVNLWSRQWSQPMQKAAVTWLRSVRARSPRAPTPTPRPNDAKLRDLLRDVMSTFLMPRLGLPAALRVTADCLEAVPATMEELARRGPIELATLREAAAALVHICLAFQPAPLLDAADAKHQVRLRTQALTLLGCHQANTHGLATVLLPHVVWPAARGNQGSSAEPVDPVFWPDPPHEIGTLAAAAGLGPGSGRLHQSRLLPQRHRSRSPRRAGTEGRTEQSGCGSSGCAPATARERSVYGAPISYIIIYIIKLFKIYKS